MKKQQCQRCLYDTDHPLGLVIDDEGICSGCRIHEEKDTLDWQERLVVLKKLVAEYKIADKRRYDCIVPVTGAQDSYFIVHTVKEVLGLNPLLVTYNKYWNTPLGIRNLANLRIKFNCDILIQNINPISVKKIVKESLRRAGNIYWHCIAGQTVFPVQTAVRYKIPLIIWGAHQGMEQVGMFSHWHEVEMTRRYRKEHDLFGLEADDLISPFNSITEKDIWQYRYPDDNQLNHIGVRGIYLNNYIRWDPKAQHELMIKHYQYETCQFSRTFDCYDYVDCFNYMDLHDRMKKAKCGYGKVTDHACREIRHGRLNREQAWRLVSFYENQPTQYEPLFLQWLGTTEAGLQLVIDQFTTDCPTQTKGEKAPVQPNFAANSSLLREQPQAYITIGKGWP